MGKTNNKKVDQAKLEAKKVRQVSKQLKQNEKRNKKEYKDEENIDAIIAAFTAKEQQRVAVTITICSQPTPRSNFSMTLLPSNEFLLFGGEYCNGQDTEIYNDLYRWNIEKNEWKHIESLNTPPPRCSHQAVCYKDKVYIFGGEYATLDNFHHYRDFWELDLKTSTWNELKTTGDAPSARSGHRMVVWRSYLVLFGGFYEAMREVKWYNDTYLYSFQDKKWFSVPNKTNSQIPKPRSGVSMCLHAIEDAIFIYGGYSKEKTINSFKEGKVHEDVWILQLKPALNNNSLHRNNNSGNSGNNSSSVSMGLDMNKISWQKISRKGDFPSTRCGTSLALYKSKAILFGGVYDEEGPRHSLISTFYNDLYAFDMERKRWYKLGLKQKKTKLDSNEKKLIRLDKLKNKTLLDSSQQDNDNNSDIDDEDSDRSDSDSDDDSNNDENENELSQSNINKKIIKDSITLANKAEKGELFGYIDETGNVVYINLKDQQEGDEDEEEVIDQMVMIDCNENESSVINEFIDTTTTIHDANSSMEVINNHDNSSPIKNNSQFLGSLDIVPIGSNCNMEDNLQLNSIRNQETLKNQLKYSNKSVCIDNLTQDHIVIDNIDALPDKHDSMDIEMKKLSLTKEPEISYIAKYFSELTEPCPRINPAVLIRGNSLYIYGGVTELGDTSIPLDDCWSLDLNKRDTWKKVLSGSMHNMIWKGEEDDDECSHSQSNHSRNHHNNSSDSDDDDDDDDISDDDSSYDNSSDNDNNHEKMEVEKHLLPKKAIKLPSHKNHSNIKGGLRAEMEGLRAHLDTTNQQRTPQSSETLRQFYSRTADYWANEVITEWHKTQQIEVENNRNNKNETLSEKEVKRLGFLKAEERYNELLPLLARLNELEEQQMDEEHRITTTINSNNYNTKKILNNNNITNTKNNNNNSKNNQQFNKKEQSSVSNNKKKK